MTGGWRDDGRTAGRQEDGRTTGGWQDDGGMAGRRKDGGATGGRRDDGRTAGRRGDGGMMGGRRGDGRTAGRQATTPQLCWVHTGDLGTQKRQGRILLAKSTRRYVREEEGSGEKTFIYMILAPTLAPCTTPPATPPRTTITTMFLLLLVQLFHLLVQLFLLHLRISFSPSLFMPTLFLPLCLIFPSSPLLISCLPLFSRHHLVLVQPNSYVL